MDHSEVASFIWSVADLLRGKFKRGEYLVTVCTVLSTVMRGERFCDGHIAAMFEAGVVRAAMARLAQLHEG